MFSKFNYSPSTPFYNSVLNNYLTIGDEIYHEHQKEVQKYLSEYISEDGIINGSELKENWFSISEKSIFISHSHKDINKVKAFAGWLYESFGMETFIDSCSWGYCDNLLNKIDKRYCYSSKTKTYNYKLRNYTTSHVHMMLATALTEMIDKTECIIFFNTPNSINMSEELDSIKKNEKTASPWIYHELMMTTMLKERSPIRKSMVLEHNAENKFQVHYDVTKVLKTMPQLSDDALKTWKNKWKNNPGNFNEEALDMLYSIVFPK